jgi:SAM-dependent methyltransferase
LTASNRPADVLELYRWAVQDPETHAALLDVIHARMAPKNPTTPTTPAPPTTRVLREDFAGTAAESVAWLARAPGRRAWAIDLDAPTIAWAQNRARRMLGPGADALAWIHADVLNLPPNQVPPADIVSALNFSIMYLTEHDTLLRYLRAARAGLRPGGVLVCNLFGGSGNQRPGVATHAVEPRPRSRGEPPVDPFEYLWEIRRFDPATRIADCRIHFRLRGPGGRPGRFLSDAFRYAFKLWDPDELTAACQEAGFARAEVWRHTYDPGKGAAGVFLGPADPVTFRNTDSWTAYIVGAV